MADSLPALLSSFWNILQMNLIELNKADRLGLPPGPMRAWMTLFKHWQEKLTMAKVAHKPVQLAMSRIRVLSADEEARRLAVVRCTIRCRSMRRSGLGSERRLGDPFDSGLAVKKDRGLLMRGPRSTKISAKRRSGSG
ncbi:hypothetical protein [Lamprobacter modestohalophilus]|uniref:hypothetical protein n=1 Tax=Lamprobacter modestohalophilus TaxID=1064514 RepID=UPI001F5B1619|nr:hypothetical protein [Lamprobacter modestohalophilus]